MVAGESRDRALELVRKMESSQRFQQTQIQQESSQGGQTRGDNVQFDITAVYIPDLAGSGSSGKEHAMMPDSRDARQKVKIAIAALVALDLIALVVMFSPLVGSERSRREQLDQLWRELQQKTQAAEPLRDFDKKIVTARQQIDDFYKNRLPAQDSAIYEEMGKLAAQSGVKIGQIRSKAKDTESVGLRPVEIRGRFFRRLSSTGALHQLAGARPVILHC